MKKLLLSLFVAVLSVGLVVPEADAKRLGGGGSSGMQRQMPARQAPNSTPPQQQPQTPAATPNNSAAVAAAPAAAAAPKRSWMGPIAGLAAGLGIAALMSHLGMGEAFGNFLMMALLAVVAIVAVRFLMRRFGANRGNAASAPGGLQYAGAGAGSGSGFGARPNDGANLLRNAQPQPPAYGGGASSSVAPASYGSAPGLPPGFDAPAFERIAKMIFIRMQAANDAADLDDLRQFATPEMFAAFRLDLQERKGGSQKTDVVQLDAEVLDVAEERGQQVVSVRYHGLIREEPNAPAAPFDEVWHLVKPTDGSREWAIAGIAQNAPA